MNFLLTFSVLGFFQSLGGDLRNGLNWLYNSTIGAAYSYVTSGVEGAALTQIEVWFLQAINSVLAVFGSLFGYVEGLFLGIGNTEMTLAGSFGVFGPILAIWILVAVIVVIFISIRVLIDLV